MNTAGLRLEPQVLAARKILAEGREKLQLQYDAGSPGIQLGFFLTDVFDEVVLGIFDAAVAAHPYRERLSDGIAIVAHSGYGRRDNAPHSDLDLMLLHSPGVASLIPELAGRLVQDLSDVGVELGFSVRTPRQACQLAATDPIISTAMMECRFLKGNESLFQKFFEKFRRKFSGSAFNSQIKAIEASRREERRKYGDTVYLLEPNIKRSRGGLRDIHLLRWVGFAAYGESLPRKLKQMGKLTASDHAKLRDARDFLLILRHGLHLHAGSAQDLLTKSEQLRIAERGGYEGDEGVLPVERFMQEYFRHTTEVRHIVSNFVAAAKWNSPFRMAVHNMFGRTVDKDYIVGPRYISAGPDGHDRVRDNLVESLRLMDLSNRHAKRIDHDLWQVIRDSMLNNEIDEVTPKAAGFFLSLLSRTGRLGQLLRRLHELHVLDKLVPGWGHARSLLQFNDYHKYTVDEHSLRAVEEATEFLNHDGELGRVYRKLEPKTTLHLALLIHDIGKGFVEDHSEVGKRIAAKVAKHLNLADREARRLEFLVHRHLMLNHLAFRRDNSDQAILAEAATEIGTTTNLRMLFVLSCADLAAVGPGVLNNWKLEVLTDLYLRLMETLSGGEESDPRMSPVRERLKLAAEREADPAWFKRHIDVLPTAYLRGAEEDHVLPDLERLRGLGSNEAVAWGSYLPTRDVAQYSVGARVDIADGIFFRLAGALASQGLEILSAEIHSLADSMFLDKFIVHDPDHSGEPPEGRFEDVSRRLVESLHADEHQPPTFRRIFCQRESGPSLKPKPTQIRIDNSISDRFTVLDVFAHDQPGLLYTIARAIHELGLSVQVAKIGTYLDQVVDVFYVTDAEGKKVSDELHLDEIRSRLYYSIESWKPENNSTTQEA